MNKRQALIAAALATVCAATVGTASAADKKDQEKCYGIAKAGQSQNDCATGTHGCASMAKSDNLASEWKFVAKGTCEKAGGKTMAPAK